MRWIGFDGFSLRLTNRRREALGRRLGTLVETGAEQKPMGSEGRQIRHEPILNRAEQHALFLNR
jgi:hypothetical protein